MKRGATFLLLASALGAQTNLSTPVRVLSNAARTVGGSLRICAPVSGCTDFGEVRIVSSGQGFQILGRSATNGNIELLPGGNVSGAASTIIFSARSDSVALSMPDNAASTSSKAIRLTTSGGTEYFAINMGGNATDPGLVKGTGPGDFASLRIGGSQVISSGRLISNILGVDQAWVPTTDNNVDLGSATFHWQDAYIINLISTTSATLTMTGDITASGDNTISIGNFSGNYFKGGYFKTEVYVSSATVNSAVYGSTSGTGGSGGSFFSTGTGGVGVNGTGKIGGVFSTNGTGTYAWDAVFGGSTAIGLLVASGSPEGVVTGNIGSLYIRTNGGASTTLYVKESGTGNTGWVGK